MKWNGERWRGIVLRGDYEERHQSSRRRLDVGGSGDAIDYINAYIRIQCFIPLQTMREKNVSKEGKLAKVSDSRTCPLSTRANITVASARLSGLLVVCLVYLYHDIQLWCIRTDWIRVWSLQLPAKP